VSVRNAYRLGLGLSLSTALFVTWGALAVGIVGIEGDPFDRYYIGVIAVGLAGAFIARFRPQGMVMAMLAAAATFALVGVLALIEGKQNAPYSSVLEILGLTAIFIVMCIAAALLFRMALGASVGRLTTGP
jgi:hypothetical protein